MSRLPCYLLFLLSLKCLLAVKESSRIGLKILTVATEANDGFQRFMQSAKRYNLDVQVLGMGKKWIGGDIKRYAGGGQKIQLLQEAMEDLKDQDDLVVMFVDSYDVVLTAGKEEILNSFYKMKAKAVFGAEDFCWPDGSLVDKYPEVKQNEKRFLNSGGFIGYASVIHEIVSLEQVGPTDDDQLYYTNIFLDESLRDKLSLKLDVRAEIFQNLHGALDEVKTKFKGDHSFLYNTKTGSTPLVVHGNGPIKVVFNQFGNYLGDQWTPTEGCLACNEGTISLADLQPEDHPVILMAIFLESPTAFAPEFFQYLADQEYPKSRVNLFLHYQNEFHSKDVKIFIEAYGAEYSSMKIRDPSFKIGDHAAHNMALEECMLQQCDYLFVVDGDSKLESPSTLRTLIERNRTVIAPLLARPGKMWSNFWGAISKSGFYQRSDDYIDIAQGRRRGIWNIPYMTGAYLIHGHRVSQILGDYVRDDLDQDMAMCANMRDKGIFMFLDNQEYYGHLTDSTNYETNHLHNDFFSIQENGYMWEKRYIDPLFHAQLDPDYVLEQPCPDVFNFPIVTPKFCTDLIEEAENHGGWSSGKHEDNRLQGGYENVPTVDIHMNQFGFEKHWLHFSKTYIAPLSKKAFLGYDTESRSHMNFLVRYRPSEQDRLRPHADSSTYTINIALNTEGLDYQGGGTRFLRYNCTVIGNERGKMLMHPGRLTHHHEGLQTTAGTRYIMISFIDP